MKVDVLNRVFILGVSCLKQGQGFKPSAAQLYSHTGQEPPQDSGLSLFCILISPSHQSYPPMSSSTVLFHVHVILTLHQHLPYSLPLLILYLTLLSFDLHQLFDLSGLCEPVHRASLLFPALRCNLIWFEYRSHSPPRCHWKTLIRNKQISPPGENLFMGISKAVMDNGQYA